MQISRSFLLRGAIIAFIFILGWVGWRIYLQRQQPAFKTTKVGKGTIEQVISASGKVKAEKEVELKFQTSGKLAWVGVKKGDKVNAWQAIAQLDQDELRKNLEKTLRDYAKQRNDFEETYRVTYRGQTPETALTDTAKRILEKNQWDLEKAVLDVELKDITSKYSTLSTPISGIVTRVDAPVAGVNIVYTTTAFTVSDPSSIQFVADVDETDIGGVEEGRKAIVILDAYANQKFEGVVKRIDFAAIATSGGGTAFPVEISLPENQNERFKIGMNGDVEIKIAKKEDTLFVPTEVISEKGGKSFLKIVRDGQPQEVEVTVGLTNDTQTEILSGVQEGEMVVITEMK